MRAARWSVRMFGVEGLILLSFLAVGWFFGYWSVALLLLLWLLFFSLWCAARASVRRRAYVVPADHDLDPGSISCNYRWVI